MWSAVKEDKNMNLVKLTRETRKFMSEETRNPEIEYDERLTPDNCETRGGYPLRITHYCPYCKSDQTFMFRSPQRANGKIIGGIYDCLDCKDTILWRKNG